MENKGYESIKTDDKDLENNGRHPANSANFLSLLTCWWMNGIFRTGNKRPLEQSDFLPLNEEDKTKVQTEKLQEQWDEHVRECSITPGKQPKLWKCVLRILSFTEVLFLLSFWSIESVFRVTLPLALGLLLALLQSTERNQPLVAGCCLFIGIAGVLSATTHYSGFRCDLLGMRLSNGLKGIVYRKVKDLWWIFLLLYCYCCLPFCCYNNHNLKFVRDRAVFVWATKTDYGRKTKTDSEREYKNLISWVNRLRLCLHYIALCRHDFGFQRRSQTLIATLSRTVPNDA